MELEGAICKTGGMRHADRIARISIQLDDWQPAIWRRAEVPLTATLKALHDVIQAAASPVSNCSSMPSPIPSTSSIANSNAGTAVRSIRNNRTWTRSSFGWKSSPDVALSATPASRKAAISHADNPRWRGPHRRLARHIADPVLAAQISDPEPWHRLENGSALCPGPLDWGQRKPRP